MNVCSENEHLLQLTVLEQVQHHVEFGLSLTDKTVIDFGDAAREALATDLAAGLGLGPEMNLVILGAQVPISPINQSTLDLRTRMSSGL